MDSCLELGDRARRVIYLGEKPYSADGKSFSIMNYRPLRFDYF